MKYNQAQKPKKQTRPTDSLKPRLRKEKSYEKDSVGFVKWYSTLLGIDALGGTAIIYLPRVLQIMRCYKVYDILLYRVRPQRKTVLVYGNKGGGGPWLPPLMEKLWDDRYREHTIN